MKDEPVKGFSADWLRLREPFDQAARAAAAAAWDFPAWVRPRRDAGGVLSVLDLACGTGANLRELAPRLGGRQRWRLVDHDAALLGALVPAIEAWGQERGFEVRAHGETLRVDGHGDDGHAFTAEVGTERLDLACELHRLPLPDAQLVTASALLDLVSADWLRDLLARAVQARCSMLFALNVEGRTEWTPPDPGDGAVHAAFAAHQGRDKGFGPALGARATPLAAQALAAAGYRVERMPSDWLADGALPGAAGRAAGALQAAMIEGMAAAALEQAAEDGAAFAAWRERRLAVLARSRLRVGHLDLRAMP